jgi:hypothetical protein
MLKFLRNDPDKCRVYYKYNKILYCTQEDFKGVFNFYICSTDGEPSHIVDKPTPINPHLAY